MLEIKRADSNTGPQTQQKLIKSKITDSTANTKDFIVIPPFRRSESTGT